jgi:hypothetical protein
VSNGLFIRSYPVKGIAVVPAAYIAGAYCYFLFCLFPVAAISFFVVTLHNRFGYQWAYWGLFASALILLLVVSLLRRLRLEIRPDGISYTAPFSGPRFTAFSEMSTVVFIDHRHLNSEAQPRGVPSTWTAIITPNPETGKPAVRIPLTFFPESACQELKRALHPEVWESGT